MIERLIGNGSSPVSDEHDPTAKGMAANFPQAFGHFALSDTLMDCGHEACPESRCGADTGDIEADLSAPTS